MSRYNLLFAAALLSACTDDQIVVADIVAPQIKVQRPDFVGNDKRDACAQSTPDKNAYFGALHIHSDRSFDSWVFGNNNGPREAYAFAKGQKMIAGRGEGSIPMQLSKPLDFAAVTDHSENFAQMGFCTDPSSQGYQHEVCTIMRGEVWWAKLLPDSLSRLGRVFSAGGRGPMAVDPSALCGNDPTCTVASESIWRENQQAAEQAYDRSSDCTFTSFPSYEYSLTPDDTGNNMHRNVIFKNATVLNYPVSANLAATPPQLWQYLDGVCNSADNDCEVLAIPHNSNLSGGQMFAIEDAPNVSLEKQTQLAALRAKTEPLVEIYQVKGDSECRNGLSKVFGDTDEACSFEKIHAPNNIVEDCGDDVGTKGMAMTGCVSRRSFVRYALIEGLAEKKRLGANPFQLGIIAASDTHESNGGDVDETDRRSALALSDEASERLQPEIVLPGGIASVRQARFSAGGLAGIFAPHNTRDALFDAMRARETFGTSGPRITPRFFAAEQFDENLCQDPNMISKAYQQGKPMGSQMQMAAGLKPHFIVSAMDDASMGAPLQRLQIIKGWVDEHGGLQQRVFDVAGDSHSDADVDLDTCEPRGKGYAQLCAVWSDDDYSQDAVYYARVLENPSCRWSTYECNALAPDDRPETCNDPNYDKTIQERAWTSPIWLETP